MRKPEESNTIDIKAPIVLDGETSSVQPLIDFVNMLVNADNEQIARTESRRLKSYLISMSRHLKKVLKAVPDNGELASKKEDLKKLTTPTSLRKTFNDMAAVTHATVLSQVVLMPMYYKDGDDNPEVGRLFNRSEFSKRYYFGKDAFNFGFIQVLGKDSTDTIKHSITFPTFGIQNRMLQAIRPHAPETLLSMFQEVMIFVNHDMLHHFTLPYIASNTAGKANPDKKSENLVRLWASTLHRASFRTEAYEDWAQVGHEKILNAAANKKQAQDICGKLDLYFQELSRIGTEIVASKKLPDGFESDPILENEEEAAARIRKAAGEVVDFYGMMMAHALVRVFPLNHGVMSHCLDLMQKTDLDPSVPKLMKLNRRDAKGWTKKRKEYLDSIKSSSAQAIIAGYESDGFILVPEKIKDVTYKHMKLMALLEISPADINPHIPSPHRDDDMRYVRRKNDEATLRMLLAAADYIATNEKEQSAALLKLEEEQEKQEKTARVADAAVVRLPTVVR